jgi:hypothetical protein
MPQKSLNPSEACGFSSQAEAIVALPPHLTGRKAPQKGPGEVTGAFGPSRSGLIRLPPVPPVQSLGVEWAPGAGQGSEARLTG